MQLQLTPDYSFAIGSSSGGNAYTFTLGGQTLAQGTLPQLALFHYDNSLSSTSGMAPSAASGVVYYIGKFDTGIYLHSGGALAYPPANSLNFSEGTIEMWVAPRFNGSDPVFANAGYPVFFYAANGDYFVMGEGGPGRLMSAGASGKGQQEVAYNSTAGDISSWKVGEWHHIAATFSATARHIRFYLDGGKISDSSEGHYTPPSASGASFQIGSTAFAIDELRISRVPLPDFAIAYDATHTTPFPDNELMLPLAGVAPGQLNYSVGGCGTATYTFTGIPISNLIPSGGLLSAGSTSRRRRAMERTLRRPTWRWRISAASYLSNHFFTGASLCFKSAARSTATSILLDRAAPPDLGASLTSLRMAAISSRYCFMRWSKVRRSFVQTSV